MSMVMVKLQRCPADEDRGLKIFIFSVTDLGFLYVVKVQLPFVLFLFLEITLSMYFIRLHASMFRIGIITLCCSDHEYNICGIIRVINGWLETYKLT